MEVVPPFGVIEGVGRGYSAGSSYHLEYIR